MLPFAGFLLGMHYQAEIDRFNRELVMFADVKRTPTPTPDPTENWQTYTNNAFSFNYPEEIIPYQAQDGTVHLQYREKLSPGEPDGYELAPGYLIDFLMVDLKNNNLKSLVEDRMREITTQMGGTILKPLTIIQIGPYSGFTFSSVIQVGTTSIYLQNKNNSYVHIYYAINDKNNKNYQAVIDKILSTFKFTDQKVTKEEAIACVRQEASKRYLNKQFIIKVTDENDSTWFTSVVDNTPQENLFGWFSVDKLTCETHFVRP